MVPVFTCLLLKMASGYDPKLVMGGPLPTAGPKVVTPFDGLPDLCWNEIVVIVPSGNLT